MERTDFRGDCGIAWHGLTNLWRAIAFGMSAPDHASRIRAITFDVGGTLIQPWPSVGHIYASVAAGHGLHNIPVDALNRQFAATWRNLRDFNYTPSQWHSLVNQTFFGLTQVPVSDSFFFSDLYEHFALAEAWRIFDDVLPVLELLNSRGLKLGIISNWDERLRILLRQLNLDRFFQTIVISCEIGQCKPSPAIFNRAAELLAFPPDSILHIGDHPVLDVDGATSSGFQALLLARGQPATPGRLNSLNLLTSHIFP